jgi:hypothetical protein
MRFDSGKVKRGDAEHHGELQDHQRPGRQFDSFWATTRSLRFLLPSADARDNELPCFSRSFAGYANARHKQAVALPTSRSQRHFLPRQRW